MEKLVIQFVNLFQLTMLLQVATILLLFLGNGKSAPLKYLKRDETMQEVFGSMGFDEKLSEETFSTIEIMFVPNMENQS